MNKIRVGVMRGGISDEYRVSLESGGNVIRNIPQDKYRVFDVLITKDGEWHIGGVPTTLEKLSKNIDVMFNALHGKYGEDGKVQRELEQFSIPYTGSKTFASAVAMNKAMAKYYFKQAGLDTPECSVVKDGDDIPVVVDRVLRKFAGPYIVKPMYSGSSVGISIAKDFDSLRKALEYSLDYQPMAIIEEYVKGREITCGVIGSTDNNEIYPTYPVEIITPDQSEFFDYDIKYSGDTTEICPPNLFPETIKNIQESASMAHKVLGMEHYSRSDFILSASGLYILETNSLPGLTENSLFPKALKSAGLEFSEFLDYVLTLALSNK